MGLNPGKMLIDAGAVPAGKIFKALEGHSHRDIFSAAPLVLAFSLSEALNGRSVDERMSQASDLLDAIKGTTLMLLSASFEAEIHEAAEATKQ